MTSWEKKIVNALIKNYFASEEERKILRLRSSHFFPNFDNVNPDEKESYLEAAEALEQKNIVILRWEKRGKGERLKTITCENFERLFEFADKQYPKKEAEKIRVMFAKKIKTVSGEAAVKIVPFLEYLSINFGSREIRSGLDRRTMENLARLLEFICVSSNADKITTRALSILLYKDSKYLERLLELCKPLLSRARKTVPVIDFSFLERRYPQTMISGKITVKFKHQDTPMVNASGHIMAIPFETAKAIEAVFLVSDKKEKAVLTIENKETFYALGNLQRNDTGGNLAKYDCFLYIGGYSNRAAAAMIKTLSASGFDFHHAGDLDPDGILIMQHIQDIAKKPVTPLRMNVDTFDQYRPWARPLDKTALRQAEKIREDTLAIAGIAALLRRIEETGVGIEQEIIDYRASLKTPIGGF